MKISVLGAGSWGTALSIHFARAGHEVLLWARDPEVSSTIRREGRHPRRLPSTEIPRAVAATSDLGEALDYSDTIVLAVPCASLRSVLESAPTHDATKRYVSTAKGIEPESLKRMSEVIREHCPGSPVAALSGPTFAEGVARGDPSAAVIAGGPLATELQAAFSTVHLRLYRSDDVVGVELAGALKNVVAIAAGIVSGLGYGHNTLAALFTRGLAEIARIVRAGGGQDRTIQGLAGVGDLMLTCTGRQSRNRRVGEEVGRGRKFSEVVVETPEVAEGARTCLAVPTMAAQAGLEAPIAEAVLRVLYEGTPAREAVENLMTRALRPE